jgi:penicillin amidase
MKRALRIGRAALLVLAGLAVIAAAGGYFFIRRAWPRASGTLVLNGLHGEVEIRRDAWGVPHIFAKEERDVFFGQGFVHAQDRLWQMQLGRALARGELSKMFGEAALESDKATRTLGLMRSGQRALALLEPDVRAAVQSYSDGVNAFLETDGKALPVEFTLLGVRPEPWQPLDVVLVGESISLAMSLNAYFEIIRVRLAAKVGEARAQELIPPYPDDAPITLLPERHAGNETQPLPGRRILHAFLSAMHGRPGGSNSWVVHGSRTKTGKPILANDTHLGLPLPSIWYENGLYAGRYSVVGFSFPGAPFVALGHNQRIAWGITNMCSDVQDLYLEKLDPPANPTRYQFKGAWHPLEIAVESIPVKDKPAVELRIASTNHGPLVNEALSAKELPPVSLRWAAHDGNTLFNALGALDRAQKWSEFKEALRSWTSPSINFTYADVDGNIGYQSTGRIPMRAKGHSGLSPVPGWTGENEWQGFIPHDELPSVTNPTAGFLVTANNKVAPDSYPHYLAFDIGDPYRAQRIAEQLAANPHVSIDDMRALQADSFSLPAKALVPHLLAVKPATELERQALELVKTWNLRFEPESAAASVYYLWYANLLDEIIGDELGPALLKDFRGLAMTQTPMFVRMMAAGNSPWFDDVRTPEKETREIISARAFAKGIAWLKERHGDDPRRWAWGRLHTMTFVHQPLGESGIAPLEWLFNSHKVQSSGEPYSVNATFIDPGVSFAVASGPAQRFIADLSALEQSLSATPIGQSGLLFHPHREDQVELWRRVDYHPMLYQRDPVTKAANELLVLRPGSQKAEEANARRGN